MMNASAVTDRVTITAERGLPHALMLIILDNANKLRDAESIDKIVCSEIPNLEFHPRLHSIVMKNMIHAPCGTLDLRSVCMTNGECSKKFPKEYCDETNPNIDGYPHYKRRITGNSHPVGSYMVDNR